MSDALAIKVEQPPAPAGDGAVVLGMIDRLLARPDVPVEKLEQLFALHQKVEADRARKDYMAALAAMQSKMPTIAERGAITGNVKDDKGAKIGTQKQSTYALWEDVNEAIRPVLTKFGFALTFRITQPPDFGRVAVTGVLSHRSGHAEETTFSLPIDNSGGKNNVQGWASSVSYGKRYTAFALLNIASRGEDDDGVKAGDTAEHAALSDINKLIYDTQSNRVWFLERYSVETMEDLSGRQRDEIKTLLQAKQAKMKKGARNG